MLTFHNDPKIKEKYIARVKAHALADEIVKGRYWQKGKGYAVGCTVHSGNHRDYEGELGIPEITARLEDSIFEGLPNKIAKEFPLKFLKSVPVGVDLKASMVLEKFMYWLLMDETHGVYQYATENGKIAINKVAILYERTISGEKIKSDEWCVAADAAYVVSRADYAAYEDAEAVDAYAAAAAASAARAAEAAYAYAHADADVAARAAADAASRAAAGAGAAREEHRMAQANKLIKLLKAA